MRRLARFLALFLIPSLFFFSPSFLFAFANNNVRVEHFKWMKVQTQHFDIYYDQSTEFLVPRMAFYLEEAWKDVGETYHNQVKTRTPFFFYSNHNEFEQTNIVPIGEGTGGVTEAFKNRLVIFNDGSEEWLRHVVYHEFTHVVQFDVLYGGFWRSIRLLKSPFYPLWMMEGMAEYGSGEIDAPTGDMVVRDAVANNQLPALPELQGFAHLKPNQVTLGYKTGEAAIQFLADEYGQDKVGKLLVSMKDFFDISAALEEVVGADLYRFDFRFHEWMRDRYAPFLKRAKDPSLYGPQLTPSDPLPQRNEGPVISSDGKKLYYFSDKGGPSQLFVEDLETKKAEPLLGLRWSVYENIHTKGRALSLSRDGRWLAFAGERRQRDFVYLFDLERKKLRRIKVPFDEIRTPVFSPVDDSLVCVGMKRGFNDLYLIDRSGRIQKRLTDNPQDERDPVFSNDGKKIIFSGEIVKEDTKSPAGRNLFEVSVEGGSPTELTNLLGEEFEPEVLPDGSLVFVRDRNDKGEYGFNLYRMARPNTSVQPLTDFIGGGFSPRYSAATNTLFYAGFFKGEKHIYQMNSLPFSLSPVPPTQSQNEKSGKGEEESNGFGDPPLSKQGKIASLNVWPPDASSPLFIGGPKRYRFQASTDIFLPFFFYSTLDGLVLVDIWQVSELMGNHQFQQQLQYASGNDLIDLAVFYTYARFRPQFTFGIRHTKFFKDFDQEEQQRETSGVGFMTYPLDRINSVNLGVGVTNRQDQFLDETEPTDNFRDRFWLAGFSHDTVTGRYLIPTKGQRLDLIYQQGFESLKGNQAYHTLAAEGSQYFPLPRESTLAARLFFGQSTGPDQQVFRLGGVDRIRGVANSLQNKKNNVVLSSAEMRFRLKYLNARTKFLFPDFFFKAAYLIVFDDIGYGWDNSVERNQFNARSASNAAGVGISWPTFILQTFSINFTVQWARRTDTNKEIWYITLGPTF